MANVEISLKEIMTTVEGTVGAAVVDYTSGMALGTMGGGKDLDLGVAAAGNTDVIRAKVRTMEHLGLKGEIEDILITLAASTTSSGSSRAARARGCSSISSSNAAGPIWPWPATSSSGSRPTSRCRRPNGPRLRMSITCRFLHLDTSRSAHHRDVRSPQPRGS